MKITVGELTAAYPSIANLCSKELPIAAAYQLARLANNMRQEYQIFDEQRQNLCIKYGEPDEENKGTYTIYPENRDTFTSEINSLMSQTINIDIDHKINISPSTGFNIPASELIDIIKFIRISDDTEKYDIDE